MDKDLWQQKGAGHRERLRERFLDRGLDGFSDGEVLELLLSNQLQTAILNSGSTVNLIFTLPVRWLTI